MKDARSSEGNPITVGPWPNLGPHGEDAISY